MGSTAQEMNTPKRILQVFTILNHGGAEAFIMNHYRKLDRTKVQFDFLVHREDRGEYEDDIERMGGRIFRTCSIRPGHYLKYFRWLNHFFREHRGEYAAVHTHIQENGGFVLKYAAKYGVPVRIAHSHCAAVPLDIRYPFRKFALQFLKRNYTTLLACGQEAGTSCFGKMPFHLFYNAIDAQQFRSNEHVRNKVRQEFNIPEDAPVIGMVARLNFAKNHAFAIRVFNEFLKVQSNAVLMLVGEGDEREKIENQIRDLGIDQHVLLTGLRNDIDQLQQAFDLFILTSWYEGLPVSVIEAQAAGTKCVLADTIDKTVDVTGDIRFLSLNDSLSMWVDTLCNSLPYKKPDNFSKIAQAGYDVNTNIGKLLTFYHVKA